MSHLFLFALAPIEVFKFFCGLSTLKHLSLSPPWYGSHGYVSSATCLRPAGRCPPCTPPRCCPRPLQTCNASTACRSPGRWTPPPSGLRHTRITCCTTHKHPCCVEVVFATSTQHKKKKPIMRTHKILIPPLGLSWLCMCFKCFFFLWIEKFSSALTGFCYFFQLGNSSSLIYVWTMSMEK